MAARTAVRRYSSVRSGQAYVYGNTVPKPVQEPERRRRRTQKVSRQVRNNQKRALRVSAGYVVFLTVAALLALVVCVGYVRLQAKITDTSKNLTAMQEELANLREENDTRYNTVMDSVNVEEIKEKAQKELGMVYATPDQVVEYESPSADYVKQYEKPECHYVRNIDGLDSDKIAKLSEDELAEYLKNGSDTKENKKYRIKPGFILREIAGEYTIIPVDAESLISNAMMVPNDSAVFLWKAFEQPSTIEDVVRKGLEEYDVTEEVIRRSTEKFVEESLEYKILEEVD